MSEALIFASTNPQYDDRLFIELQVQYMKIPSSEHGENMLCTEIVTDIQNNFVHNMFFPSSAKRRASDKDLPVLDFVLNLKIIQKISCLGEFYVDNSTYHTMMQEGITYGNYMIERQYTNYII